MGQGRLEYKRQKKMAEFARKDGGRVDAVTGADIGDDHTLDVPPTPSLHEAPRHLVKAVNQLTQMVAAPNGNGDQRGRDANRQTGDRSPRLRSPNVKTGFSWDPENCWHCAGKHRRETCKQWLAIVKKHNGNAPRAEWKPPPGYQEC